jgi:class 3 adenylate cyclase
MDASTGYAKSGTAHIAYSVIGDGPLELQYVSSYTISIDSLDDEPHVAHYFRRLASFGSLTRFDMRGIGLSDPSRSEDPLTIESFAADILAVFDARGVERAVLIAETGGALAAIELAATRPDRVESLVIVNGYARAVVADDYPYGHPRELAEAFLEQNVDPAVAWDVEGSTDLDLIAPSMSSDARFAEWWQRSSRRGASPATALAMLKLTTYADVRDRLPLITVPTLVIHREENRFIPPSLGHYLADQIPGARYVGLPGADNSPWTRSGDEVVDEIEEFLTGRRTDGGARVLATVMFTDIVDSTGRAAAMGDTDWRSYLDTHDSIVRSELRRYGGREVNTTGDGFVGAFESPTQAARCAHAVIVAAAAKGIAVRVGLHTGECERRGDDLAGLTVHIAARVGVLAASGEVLVSRTVRDLLVGSGLRFVPRGEHVLKGVPETWQLFALEPA